MCAPGTRPYRRRMTTLVTPKTLAAAALIAALAWVDPLFLPLIGLGPIVSGLAAGATGTPPRTVAVVWFTAGLLVLVSDLVINGEDVAFHAVVALVTAGLGSGSAAIGARLRGSGRVARTADRPA